MSKLIDGIGELFGGSEKDAAFEGFKHADGEAIFLLTEAIARNLGNDVLAQQMPAMHPVIPSDRIPGMSAPEAPDHTPQDILHPGVAAVSEAATVLAPLTEAEQHEYAETISSPAGSLINREAVVHPFTTPQSVDTSLTYEDMAA